MESLRGNIFNTQGKVLSVFLSKISEKIELSNAVMCYFKCSTFENFPSN